MILTDLIFLATETIIKDDSLTVTVESNSSLELLGVAIASSLIGIIVGTAVSIRKERDKENRELVKVKDLIQNDFREIFSKLNLGIENIEKVCNGLIKNDDIIEEVINRKPDQSALTEILLETIVRHQISFYDAITHSGKLIMLGKNEIMAYQSFNQFIEKTTNTLEKDMIKRSTNIRKIKSEGFDKITEKNKITTEIIMFLQVRLSGYKNILKSLHGSYTYCTWIDYETKPELFDIID